MIIEGSLLLVADNSGAKRVKCIKVLGGSRKKRATIGDLITVSARVADPNSKNVKEGEVYLAVVVQVAQKVRRKDGSWLKFSKNFAVLINKQHEPIGTRVLQAVPRELMSQHPKIISLAPEVV